MLELVALYAVVLLAVFGVTWAAELYNDALPHLGRQSAGAEQLALTLTCLVAAASLAAATAELRPGRARERNGTRAPGRGRLRDDRGSTSLELVILFPIVLAMIFGLVQGGLYYHARNVASAAAREGLRADAAYLGSAQDGSTAAHRFLDANSADQVLTKITVITDRSATQAKCTVKATAISIVPGLAGPPVNQSASGPVERETKP